MGWITYIGFAAAFLTTVALLPQILKSWRTKRTKDISFRMYILLVSGVFLWLVYGIFTRDFPLIVANFVTLIFTGSVLVMKVRYG